MDGPRHSYANVKYEPAGKRKARRLLESYGRIIIIIIIIIICYYYYLWLVGSHTSQIGERCGYVNNAYDISRQNLTGLSNNCA